MSSSSSSSSASVGMFTREVGLGVFAGLVGGLALARLFSSSSKEKTPASPRPVPSTAHSTPPPTTLTIDDVESLPWNKHGVVADVSDPDIRTDCVVKKVHLLAIPHLRDAFPEEDAKEENKERRHRDEMGDKLMYRNPVDEKQLILADIVRKSGQASLSRGYVRAGPRSQLFFRPSQVRAAIVTCGGLCPGLNNVIRELVFSLFNLYDVEAVLGVRDGYLGFHEDRPPIPLTPATVADIHHRGGTILGTARGGFDIKVILNFLREHRIHQLYVIGGDGTHRGAIQIHEACLAAHMPVAVIGCPKTIDNDVDLIDRSFGFQSSVEKAQAAITSAAVEARCAPRGVGIVKLMGRHAGFIAAHAALASSDVDLVLVPEVEFRLEGEFGILRHLERVLDRQGYAVVVVAEGAGEELLSKEALSGEVDAGGHRKLPAIAEFLKKQIKDYFARDDGMPASVKLIDPSYIIRSCHANAADALLCMLLGQNAVHGAMAGFTGMSVGLVNNRVVYIPMTCIVANSPRVMDPVGRTWERVISMTKQPDLAVPWPERQAQLLALGLDTVPGTVTGRTLH